MACPSPTLTLLAPKLSLSPRGPSHRKAAATGWPLRARTRATAGDAASAAEQEDMSRMEERKRCLRCGTLYLDEDNSLTTRGCGGRLHAVRAIAGRAPPLPFLLRHLAFGADAGGAGDVVLCVEHTDVDAPAWAMRVVSRNATLRGIVDVEERCSYLPHPDRLDEWTLFRQETSIRCAPLAAVATKVAEVVERRCSERFVQNAAKEREVVERICECLADEDSSRPR